MVADPSAPLRLALLPSPLLGPAVWAPVARVLGERGRDVVLPSPYPPVRSPDDVLAHLLAALDDGPVVLVPHSNAGLYAAALAEHRDVRAVVFVDAGLPEDAPTTPTAPEPFRELLAGLVEPDGLLPVWSRWWPAEDVDVLFPDDETRATVEAEQVRLPPGYFDATVPSPPSWADLPAAYLGLGDTYRHERDEARRRGWPVERLEGGHLHPLVAPDAVAGALLGLLGRLGLPGWGAPSIRV